MLEGKEAESRRSFHLVFEVKGVAVVFDVATVEVMGIVNTVDGSRRDCICRKAWFPGDSFFGWWSDGGLVDDKR